VRLHRGIAALQNDFAACGGPVKYFRAFKALLTINRNELIIITEGEPGNREMDVVRETKQCVISGNLIDRT